MDSEDETVFDDGDSGNESSVDDVDFATGVESKNPFEVLNTDQVYQLMIDFTKEVNAVVEIPATTTRILLNHFKWDKEKLMERYYDTDQDELFNEAKVINPFKTRAVIRPKPLKRTALECEICFLILPSSTMIGLGCGHCFCTECWVGYLTTKIMEEGVGQTIACAAYGCDKLVDDGTVMGLVEDSKVRLEYERLITNSFVECNRLLRWCPSPGCNNVLKVQYKESRPVYCSCGHVFCFSCGENWHDPVKCDILKKWIKKCDDDAGTCEWIALNTKDCPKCNAPIQKDGGCNYIICRSPTCNAEFCWLCLGSWESHVSAGLICNRYCEERATVDKNSFGKSRAALNRYVFFYKRYMNHMQSLKSENKLYESLKEKMEEMHQHNMSWFEIQFCKKAVDILCQCRQTLMYTYIFAYYLQLSQQSIIFEDNQKDLESATETLAGYLVNGIRSGNLPIKQQVLDKYRYCDSRRKVLLGHVHEGYDSEWWEYFE